MLRLLNGEKLYKKELINQYQKSESSIQRDISYIDNLFKKKFENRKSLLTNGKDKGEYSLDIALLLNKYKLTHTEAFALLSILSDSRAFNNSEYNLLIEKVLKLTEIDEKIPYQINNDTLEYKGVPNNNILGKIKLISEIIEQKKGIEFTYKKNGITTTFQRTPAQIFFSDLYFFMASDNHKSEDDADLTKLNKFRINNMFDLKVISKKETLDYSSRFKTGELRNSTWLPFYGKDMTLIIDYYYEPAYVIDRFPNSKIIKEGEGYTRFSIQVNNGWGTKMWLLSQGISVKVISPKYMANFVADTLKTTLSYYE